MNQDFERSPYSPGDKPDVEDPEQLNEDTCNLSELENEGDR